ncbi:MAG: hypothetical protein K2V38_15515 [Gemmataceae bacterium]|nr:hypothetical protein [Gemmataceae bacterium]
MTDHSTHPPHPRTKLSQRAGVIAVALAAPFLLLAYHAAVTLLRLTNRGYDLGAEG